METDTEEGRNACIQEAKPYLAQWNCASDGEIFFTHSSLLWPVKRNDQRLMLKIVKPEDDEAHGAAALSYFGGTGAVDVAESNGHVQLLERIQPAPGLTLEEMVLRNRDDAATGIICDVIEKLHSNTNTAPETFIPFRNRSDAMRKHIKHGRIKGKDLPMFQMAVVLCEKLISETTDTQRALHGDIHHFNVMQSSTRGWLAIDPKGIYGPRAYEYANTLCNPYIQEDIVANPARMSAQADIICKRATLDKDQLLQFTFLHAMQCAAWSLFEEDKGYWLACAKTAAQLTRIHT